MHLQVPFPPLGHTVQFSREYTKSIQMYFFAEFSNASLGAKILIVAVY